MLDAASSSHVCNRSTTAQSWAQQWKNIGQNTAQQCEREEWGGEKYEKQSCRHQGQSSSWQDLRLVESPLWIRFILKHCSRWRGPRQEQFLKGGSPWERPTLEQWKSVRRKEWQRGIVMDWLQPPTPHRTAQGVGRWRSQGQSSEVETGKKSGVGGKCFSFCLYFSISKSVLTDNELN